MWPLRKDEDIGQATDSADTASSFVSTSED